MSTTDQSLTQSGGSKAERRYLTVLFGDMVGSSALSARLDPEDLRHILRAFQSCCGDAIRNFAGHIGRYMGDGLLAYFGHAPGDAINPHRPVAAGTNTLILFPLSEASPTRRDLLLASVR